MTTYPIFAQQLVPITGENVTIQTGANIYSEGVKALTINTQPVRPRPIPRIPVVNIAALQSVLTTAAFTPGTYGGVVAEAGRILLTQGQYQLLVSGKSDVDDVYVQVIVTNNGGSIVFSQTDDAGATIAAQAGITRSFRTTFNFNLTTDCQVVLKVQLEGSANVNWTNSVVEVAPMGA